MIHYYMKNLQNWYQLPYFFRFILSHHISSFNFKSYRSKGPKYRIKTKC